MIRMIARRAVPYRGHTYRPGEQFDASPIDAAALRYQGQADFVPTVALGAGVPSAEAAPTRRKYRRRDMQAEK